jgi:membrane associated rhomboid family serine protease
MNTLLIAANVIVFFLEAGLSTAQIDRVIHLFGFIPAQFSFLNPISYLPIFTSMFMHGGWFHIISNMWILFIFGDNVEDRMGSLRYLVFYLLGGVAAALLHVFVQPTSTIPVVGASGAIAAVMGAYFLLFPRARVISLVPIFVFAWFVQVPAVIYLGVWFVSQLYSGVLSLGGAGGVEMGGVAWWAHIGGFVFGLLLAGVFGVRRKRTRRYMDEYYPW